MEDKRAPAAHYADAANAAGPSDPPPAYSLDRSPSRSSSESSRSSVDDHPQQPLPPPSIPRAPPPATSGLYLSTRRDAISGTYILDPYAPEISSLDRRRDKPSLPREAKRALRRNAQPSVALASRRGHINVRLIVQNSAPFTSAAAHPPPALICADARRGNIYLDIVRPSVPSQARRNRLSHTGREESQSPSINLHFLAPRFHDCPLAL